MSVVKSITDKVTKLSKTELIGSNEEDNGSGVNGIEEEIVYGHIGHWEKCKKDRDCELFDDVCCESRQSYKSKDEIMLCGPAERMSVTSGKYSGWKFKCPENKIQKNATWLTVGSSVIALSMY